MRSKSDLDILIKREKRHSIIMLLKAMKDYLARLQGDCAKGERKKHKEASHSKTSNYLDGRIF